MRYLDIIRGTQRGPGAACARFGLKALSGLYRAGLLVRNARYRLGLGIPAPPPVPVVSVGNLTVGGTGKTPVVEWLAGRGLGAGLRTGILLRGYGRERGERLNEEGRLLEWALPAARVHADPDRVRGAHHLHAEGVQWIVLDDGFQHRRLRRALDIVLVDVTQPFGFGHLLPRGLLREPVSALRRAHVGILTRCDQIDPEEVRRLKLLLEQRAPHMTFWRSTHRPTGFRSVHGAHDLEYLAGTRVRLLSGIGNPEAFERTATSLGLSVEEHVRFPDHHRYRAADLESLAGDLPIVMTTKDWIKVEPLLPAKGSGPSFYALRIELALATEDANSLWSRVEQALA